MVYSLDVLRCLRLYFVVFCFFFNDTATTEIYTLSLHDALPISDLGVADEIELLAPDETPQSHLIAGPAGDQRLDRKSTRLNSSHLGISYAVFCLKKKKKKIKKIKSIHKKHINNIQLL